MGSQVTSAKMAAADLVLQDPGNGGALPTTEYGQVQIRTLAAETRTAANPSKPGLQMSLAFRSDGGDCVITFASAYDDNGTTVLTLTDVGQVVTFESVRVSNSACRWRMTSQPPGITATPAEVNTLDGILATTAELNRAADVSTRIVPCTAATLAVTVAEHDGKIIELDRAAGIAVTLPSLAAALGARFEFRIKTTFTGAASIKSVAGTDIMVGHAVMGNDSDTSVVAWRALASDTFDTIDLFTAGNTTGGFEGQKIVIIGGTGRWYVEIEGDAAGTEATPFQNTVA
jgi:hypothetical protein